MYIMTENNMRNIKATEELIIKTFGVDYKKVNFNSLNITDKHVTFSLEWMETGNILQATITNKAVKPKFTLEKNDDEFVANCMTRLFYIKNELYSDEDINDDLFENQEYDPARGYVDKQPKEVEGQEVMQLEDSKGE